MEQNSIFFKVYGAEKENNTLLCLNGKHYVLFYGFFTDEIGNYRLRKDYLYKPSIEEIRKDIGNLIDEQTSNKILSGFTYEGDSVWLSLENQLNFRSAVCFPCRFKIGETEGVPTYRTFLSSDELLAFNNAITEYIHSCLEDGWKIKDSVDYNIYEEAKNEI